MSRRVSPGTRLREVADVVAQVTGASGRGATLPEIQATYHRRYGPLDPRGISRAVLRLEASGVIHKIGGRHRRTQWAHVDHPVRFREPEDVAPLLMEIVEGLCARLGRSVETREIAAELAGRGVEGFSNDQVRTRLESLAHGSDRKTQRTVGQWSEPKVRRIAGTTSGGRRHVTWAPLREAVEQVDFRDTRDAVRYAVQRVAVELRRPATRREILFWARARLASESLPQAVADSLDLQAARVVCSSRFRAALAGTAASDPAPGEGDGRIRTVRTPLSSRGAYPVRFAAGPASEIEQAVCLVEDLAALLRPRTEMEGVERLRREAEGVGSELLMEIAASRVDAIRGAFVRLAPDLARAPTKLADVCQCVADAKAVAAEWARRSGARGTADLTAHSEVPGFLSMVQQPVAQIRSSDARGVGQLEGAKIAEIEDLAREALQMGDRDVRHWSPLIAGVRRVRGPVRGGISAEDPTDTESVLDRVDAVRAVAAAAHLPPLGALLAMADDVLGGGVRDGGWVRDCLKRARTGDVELRQALVVALGMLGEPAPVELAWQDPGDAGEAVAYLASIAFGVDDYERRVQLVEDADLRARGAAMEVAERVLSRVASACRLSAVD